MAQSFELEISETGCNSPKDEPRFFNSIHKSFKTIDELKTFMVERYGRIPGGKRKIYRDHKDGQSIEVGFIHSYWVDNYDKPHHKYFQSDWIEFFEQQTEISYIKLQ
jgi:hypothetical protein